MADEGGEVQEIEMEVEEPESGGGGEEPSLGGEKQQQKGREEVAKVGVVGVHVCHAVHKYVSSCNNSVRLYLA